MARQVQIIKGTAAQNEAFTGAEGVLTYDSDNKDIRIHDGTTAGGFEIPSAAVMADYIIYWDHADATDHSHAKPGVETPTNHGWYRYYKSGWVEQGYTIGNLPQGNLSFTFFIPMRDTNYTVSGGGGFVVDGYGARNLQKSTTALTGTSNVRVCGVTDIEVKGYAA